MSVFADTSAVVKLYADESEFEVIRALDAMFVSQLCRVELPAALWRKSRVESLAVGDVRVLIRAFENDLFEPDGPLVPIKITNAILDDAATLTANHGLRTYDAIQLATARATREFDPECDTLAAFDRDLRRAASSEGFVLLPADAG